jgi:hypothetical protein
MSFNDNPYLNEYPNYSVKKSSKPEGYVNPSIKKAQTLYDYMSDPLDNMNKSNKTPIIPPKTSFWKRGSKIKNRIVIESSESSDNDNTTDTDGDPRHDVIFTRLDELKEKQDLANHQMNKQQIDELKEDILQLAGEVQNAANDASKELDEQGNKLLEIDPKLDQITNNLERSDNIVSIIRNKLNKFAFWKANKQQKPSRFNSLPSELEKISKQKEEDGKIISIIQKKTSDDEFCDLLVGQLKNIQKTNDHIGEELDAHNDALKHMSKKVNNNNKHLDEINRDIFRLLR